MAEVCARALGHQEAGINPASGRGWQESFSEKEAWRWALEGKLVSVKDRGKGPARQKPGGEGPEGRGLGAGEAGRTAKDEGRRGL